MPRQKAPDAADAITKKIREAQSDAPLKCRCGKSARFIPMYRFAANSPSVLLQHAHTIRCGECGQWLQWQTDGWVRVTQLEDLEQLD